MTSIWSALWSSVISYELLWCRNIIFRKCRSAQLSSDTSNIYIRFFEQSWQLEPGLRSMQCCRMHSDGEDIFGSILAASLNLNQISIFQIIKIWRHALFYDTLAFKAWLFKFWRVLFHASNIYFKICLALGGQQSLALHSLLMMVTRLLMMLLMIQMIMKW